MRSSMTARAALSGLVYVACSIIGRRGHPRRVVAPMDLDREVRGNGAREQDRRR